MRYVRLFLAFSVVLIFVVSLASCGGGSRAVYQPPRVAPHSGGSPAQPNQGNPSNPSGNENPQPTQYQKDQPTHSSDFTHPHPDPSKGPSDFYGTTYKNWIMEGKTNAFAESANLPADILDKLVADLSSVDQKNFMIAGQDPALSGLDQPHIVFPPRCRYLDWITPSIYGNFIYIPRTVFVSWEGYDYPTQQGRIYDSHKTLDGMYTGYLSEDGTRITGRWTFFYKDPTLPHPEDAKIFYADETMHVPAGPTGAVEQTFAGATSDARKWVDLWGMDIFYPTHSMEVEEFDTFFFYGGPMVRVDSTGAMANLYPFVEKDAFWDGKDVFYVGILADGGIPEAMPYFVCVFTGTLEADGSLSGKFLLGDEIGSTYCGTRGTIYAPVVMLPSSTPFKEEARADQMDPMVCYDRPPGV